MPPVAEVLYGPGENGRTMWGKAKVRLLGGVQGGCDFVDPVVLFSKEANESSSDSAKAEETEAVRLVPGFNRANLFVPTKSTSWHAVEVVEPEATGLRLSFTSWMALPAGW